MFSRFRSTSPLSFIPFKIFKPNYKYPLIKSNKWSGVIPVENIDDIPDWNMQYNLLIELVSGIQNKKDSSSINNINGGLSEVGRILNLHIGAGIPGKNCMWWL